MIQSKIIADSLGPNGDRLTTFVVTFPRIVLAEFNTHRMFSRNSASSRAIPFEKMVKSVEENPFVPIAWQKDHKGMQGTEYLTELENQDCIKRWLEARDNAIIEAKKLSSRMVTKQLCNRLLEPFMWHTTLVTATELNGFFELRCPKYTFGSKTDNPKSWRSKKDAIKDFPDWITRNDLFWYSMNESQAEIHIQALAEVMWDSYNESTPKELKAGGWHIPFGDQIEFEGLLKYASSVGSEEDPTKFEKLPIKIATARCARVSYTVVGEEDKKPNHENDIKLHDRLLDSKHFSPFEHCAKAMDNYEYNSYVRGIIEPRDFYEDFEYVVEPLDFRDSQGWCRNYRGFIQYRELIN